MENDVILRLKTYMKSGRYTIRLLANKTQINEGTLSAKLNGGRGMDLQTLCVILDSLPELSAEWLLRGNGSMEIQPTSTDEELRNVCIEQAKEIYQLRNQLARLKEEK